MRLASIVRTAGVALLVVAGPLAATAADLVITMADLALHTRDYVGKRVVVSDCLMIGTNHIVGAQCSIDPINAGILVTVDADTWTPQAQKLADDCSTAIIELMCVLKVTGVVDTNKRGEAVIVGASLELVKRTQAI